MISQNFVLKRSRSLLAAVFFIFLTARSAIAMPADIRDAQHQYQVDVLIFRQNPALVSALEAASPPTPLLLSPNTLLVESLPTVANNQSALADPATRLSKNNHYTIVWQRSWIQTIKPPFSAQPIRIQAGEAYSNGLSEIDGTLTFSQQNYINVSTDLRFTEPNQGYQQWRLKQTQRLRADELHYFDHPLFGILIQVSPYSDKPVTQTVYPIEP
ncbi:MAG: hypothetical protein K0R12_653 [Gammaproteobacteria bacterium]|jgi:hypothetical protein|nr:hypothetical protein [Gammaproteobacteria bacterium]